MQRCSLNGGLNKWNVLASDDLVKDEWLHLCRHRCLRSDGSIVDPYYVINGRDWINIMPVTRNGLVYHHDRSRWCAYRQIAIALSQGTPSFVHRQG